MPRSPRTQRANDSTAGEYQTAAKWPDVVATLKPKPAGNACGSILSTLLVRTGGQELQWVRPPGAFQRPRTAFFGIRETGSLERAGSDGPGARLPGSPRYRASQSTVTQGSEQGRGPALSSPPAATTARRRYIPSEILIGRW